MNQEDFKNTLVGYLRNMAVQSLDICSAEIGFLTRMSDKFCRINNFVKKGSLQVKTESVGDTLLDLANYCLLLACYMKSKREGV